MKLGVEFGPDAQTRFASLNDLNGNLVVARIQAGAVNRPILSALTLNIESNAGRQLLYYPLRLISEKGGEGILRLKFSSTRFVGICIPEGFFGITRSRG